MNRHRILVAYDGSEEARRALERAADVAQHGGGELGIVTVMPDVPRALDAARHALRELRKRGVEATLHAPVGDPATEIARVVDDGAYHTVYLGTRHGEVGREVARGVGSRVSLRGPAGGAPASA